MSDLPDIGQFKRRLDELDAQMASPSFYEHARKATAVSREQQKLAKMIEDHAAFTRLGRYVKEAGDMLRDPKADGDLRELAEAELPELEARREVLREEILAAMIPPEPTDSRNTVLEIRAGTGGEGDPPNVLCSEPVNL